MTQKTHELSIATESESDNTFKSIVYFCWESKLASKLNTKKLMLRAPKKYRIEKDVARKDASMLVRVGCNPLESNANNQINT